MKNFRHISLLTLFLTLAGMVAFTACSDDDHIGGTDSDISSKDSLFTIVDTTVYTIDQVADLLYGPDGANADNDKREAFLRRARAYDDSLSDLTGANGEVTTDYIKVDFQYVDAEDKSNRLSATAIWRRVKDAEEYSNDLEDNMWLFSYIDKVFVIEQEYVNNDSDLTTRNDERMFAYLETEMLVYTDRKGYGRTLGQKRTHLDAEQNAANTRNAINVAEVIYQWYTFQEYADKLSRRNNFNPTDYIKFKDDYKVYVAGINEGASVALAVQKYYDSNPAEKEKRHFGGAICFNGIYNPHLTFDLWMKTDKIDDPLLIPMFIKESLTRYPLEKVQEDQLYSDNYLSHKAEIEALIDNSELSRKAKNDKLKELLGVDVVKPSDMLSKELLDKGTTYMYFITNLDHFNLSTDWTPASPICLIHADNDANTPLTNATNLQKKFSGNAPCTLQTIHYTDEQLNDKAECGMPASLVLDWYNNEMWRWNDAYSNAAK